MLAKTIAAGGNIQRNLVRRKIVRMLKEWRAEQAQLALVALLDWLNKQPKRLLRPSGLGRK